MSDPTSLDWYPPEDENRRDAIRDEAAFDDRCPHLNCDPMRRGWKCIDCGEHMSNETVRALLNAQGGE